jgi:hypothetical protein
MTTKDTRTKVLNMSAFWHIILPTIILLLLLFVLFVVFTMPDWALECSGGLAPLRNLVSSASE